MSHRRRDDSKLSFSDLDKRRRERKHGGGGAGRDTPQASAHAQKSYRAALERAFDSGKLAEFAATIQRTRDPLPAGAHIDAVARPASPDGAASPGHAGGQPTDATADATTEATVDQPAAPGTAPDPAGPADGTGQEQAVVEPAAPPLPRARTGERAERLKLARKITEATAPRDMGKAVDRYLARFGSLPDDYEALEKILSHPKPRVVLQALEALETWVARQKPRRSRSLAVQLSILEDTHEDSEIRALAARVRAAL
jgi:hypothetical protein